MSRLWLWETIASNLWASDTEPTSLRGSTLTLGINNHTFAISQQSRPGPSNKCDCGKPVADKKHSRGSATWCSEINFPLFSCVPAKLTVPGTRKMVAGLLRSWAMASIRNPHQSWWSWPKLRATEDARIELLDNIEQAVRPSYELHDQRNKTGIS